MVGSSFFGSATAVNPTLTIVANALRVADHLSGRLGADVPAETPQAALPQAGTSQGERS